MNKSDAVWIAEITTLRTRLSEAEAENARLKKPGAILHDTRVYCGCAVEYRDRMVKAEAALREAQEYQASFAKSQELLAAEIRKREEAERAARQAASLISQHILICDGSGYPLEEALSLLPAQEKQEKI